MRIIAKHWEIPWIIVKHCKIPWITVKHGELPWIIAKHGEIEWITYYWDNSLMLWVQCCVGGTQCNSVLEGITFNCVAKFITGIEINWFISDYNDVINLNNIVLLLLLTVTQLLWLLIWQYLLLLLSLTLSNSLKPTKVCFNFFKCLLRHSSRLFYSFFHICHSIQQFSF